MQDEEELEPIANCLVCGKPVYSRGLCQNHYREFNNILKALRSESQEKGDLYEAVAVKNGWALPLQNGGRPKESKDTRFKDLEKEIRELTPMSEVEDRLRVIEQESSDNTEG